MEIIDTLKEVLLTTSVGAYLTWLAVFFGILIILNLIRSFLLTKLKKTSIGYSGNDLAVDIIDDLHWPFYTFIALYIVSQLMILPELFKKVLNYMLIMLIGFYFLLALNKIINYFTEKQIESLTIKGKKPNGSALRLLSKLIKFFIIIISSILILSNLGVNVTSLLAGLGISGIAIAFALQRILEDVFSSFSIYMDKPFEEGDSIVVGEDMGIVKQIGLKTTRLITLQGDELVISNKEITSTRVHNMKKMSKRRATFNFSVNYDTTTIKLKKIKSIVEDIIKKTELCQLDRVHFKSFGDYGLLYEVRYYVDSNDYNKYMDAQEIINLAIKEKFEKETIHFAFPTRIVHLTKDKF
jgi:small-conductance mechanosensitive channel